MINLVNLPWGKFYTSWGYTVEERYENSIRKYLTCKDGDVAIDIGAHQGFYTIKFSKESGKDGSVYAIEPENFNYNALLNNIKENNLKNVITINAALSDYIGIGTLYTYRSDIGWDSGKHFLRGSCTAQPFGTELDKDIKPPEFPSEVKVTTLDNIVSEYGIRKIDLIKIDTEGAEFKILKGAKRTLNEYSPRLVIEIHYNNNVRDLLEEYGYEMIDSHGMKISRNNAQIYERR